MAKDYLVKLGNSIRKRSQSHFKTNVDFAFACDVDEKTIRRIFRGEQNVSLSIFKKISKALNIKMSDLLSEIGE